LAQYEQAKQIISGVRAVRNSKNIAQKEALTLEVVSTTELPLAFVVAKMANLSGIQYVERKGEGSQSFLIGTQEYAIPLGNLIDTDAEVQKAEAEIKRLEGFMMGIEKKLQNERFVQNAPAQVVEMERKKLHDAECKIAALKETVAALQK
ncbi:MAG: valine--tRNA ligase, partial [Bacteroidaceae bacterium]|nr:valine--tRNA ligase [Bacteroidaceae bacterium]